MRRALGATRLALARQVTVEAGLLVGPRQRARRRARLGGAAGDPRGGARRTCPRIAQLQLDAGVILASVGLALVGLVLAGLLPALAIMDAGLGDARESAAGRAHTPGRTPARGIAVAAQTTVAVVTVATALLLGRTLQRLERLDIGFEPAGLSLFQVAFLSPGSRATSRRSRRWTGCWPASRPSRASRPRPTSSCSRSPAPAGATTAS